MYVLQDIADENQGSEGAGLLRQQSAVKRATKVLLNRHATSPALVITYLPWLISASPTHALSVLKVCSALPVPGIWMWIWMWLWLWLWLSASVLFPFHPPLPATLPVPLLQTIVIQVVTGRVKPTSSCLPLLASLPTAPANALPLGLPRRCTCCMTACKAEYVLHDWL